MNDTQILDHLVIDLKNRIDFGLPLSPNRANYWVNWIAEKRGELRKPPLDATVAIRQMDKNQYLESPVEWTLPAVEPPFQNYWRCEHYPIAIENFFRGRPQCACTDG